MLDKYDNNMKGSDDDDDTLNLITMLTMMVPTLRMHCSTDRIGCDVSQSRPVLVTIGFENVGR